MGSYGYYYEDPSFFVVVTITFLVCCPWMYVHVQERRLETALARLWTNHTRLTHGYLMSRKTKPFCNDCLVLLTVRHFLVVCPSLLELRERYLFRCCNEDGAFRVSMMILEEVAPST